ncbi:hypothetical protein [Roseovarius sp. M141]|uniref:hypothetical protein n=1 Tax=Roseovarius sp. M141 TaxID=2583806 RepID=UPI0020CD2A7F|nr:hypothetical protein [Roseovarius sp. M141]MCQ0090517.1 hypothetical protein [Roseovarius sp. M141]
MTGLDELSRTTALAVVQQADDIYSDTTSFTTCETPVLRAPFVGLKQRMKKPTICAMINLLPREL